jgi:hypothetical protein
MSDQKLKIFISHKMEKDGDLAEALARLLRRLSAGKIEVIYAQQLRSGRPYHEFVDDGIAESDIFILLYTGLDIDWQQCLVEAGQFKAHLKARTNSGLFDKRISVLHSDRIEAPRSLSEFTTVRAIKRDVHRFLNDIFIKDKINLELDEAELESTAEKIVSLFESSVAQDLIFDLVPNFSISFEDTAHNKGLIDAGSVPDSATLKGTQDWEVLFDRDFSQRIWYWDEITSDWDSKELYQFEITRMIIAAMQNKQPEGCFIRPRGNRNNGSIYRLTLRRLYKNKHTQMFDFYFNAAPIDLPIFGMDSKTDLKEFLIYNMINITWYARRRLIDQYYKDITALLTSGKSGPAMFKAKKRKLDQIKHELISIEIQSRIRDISEPAYLLGVFGPIHEGTQDQRRWEGLKNEIFAASEREPEPDLYVVAQALYEIAEMNYKYYQQSAAIYAGMAEKLEMPEPPPGRDEAVNLQMVQPRFAGTGPRGVRP